jgi:DNA mismatch endonuclease (patch repair protein)
MGRKVAVFVDGAFWHGHPDYYWHQSGPFWNEKIERNKARDLHVNSELAKAGWAVVRIWDFEIARNLGLCVEQVAQALQEKGAPAASRNRRRAEPSRATS